MDAINPIDIGSWKNDIVLFLCYIKHNKVASNLLDQLRDLIFIRLFFCNVLVYIEWKNN